VLGPKSQIRSAAARANGINRDVRKLCIAQHQPKLRVTRNVLRFANNQHHAPILYRSRLEQVHSFSHRIVQPHLRRFELNARNRTRDCVVVVRERLTNLHRTVVGHYRRLTVQGHDGFREDAAHPVNYWCHHLNMRTGLNYQRDSQRIASQIPMLNRLLRSVVVYTKIALRKIQH
jgi:hypothetical protein